MLVHGEKCCESSLGPSFLGERESKSLSSGRVVVVPGTLTRQGGSFGQSVIHDSEPYDIPDAVGAC